MKSSHHKDTLVIRRATKRNPRATVDADNVTVTATNKLGCNDSIAIAFPLHELNKAYIWGNGKKKKAKGV